ncbi:MAG: DUF6580 family putative transport protein [Roseimicrobium sp.]
MTHQPSLSHRNPTAWFPLALMVAVLALRVLGQHDVLQGLPNLSPLMALAFAGTVVLPRPLPWWSWAIVLLGVDAVSQGASLWQREHLPVILLTYTCYAGAAYWASRVRGQAGVSSTVVGTVTCSVAFYLVTNTFCWAVDPFYAKTGAGWAQALTVGIPGPWPTTLEFFRNSLLADLMGALVLLLAYHSEAFARRLPQMR